MYHVIMAPLYIYNNCTNSPFMYTNEAATQQYDVNEAGLLYMCITQCYLCDNAHPPIKETTELSMQL